ncbi:HAMP domain-containing sensor histidine kinase [Paenibacillus sp. KN14-4R]|uniref:HAMP domain-containing sensor histidine kinase n=1 Tax=Paenibacillus sp. KN14-4R TaxID=3445773 RepID=UPI003F9FD2B7
MFTKSPDKFKPKLITKRPQSATVPLVRYWTWRYVMILLIMLTGIGLFGMYWIQKNTQEQQFQLLEARSTLMTDTFSKMDQLLQSNSSASVTPSHSSVEKPIVPIPTENNSISEPAISVPAQLVPDIPDGYLFQIFDQTGAMIYYFSNANDEKGVYLQAPPHQSEVLAGKKIRELVNTESGKWLRVAVPFLINNKISGTLHMSAKYNEDRLPQLYGLIVLTIGLIALCGWAVVYVLSRSLTRPLIQLGHAANAVSHGNYTPDLPDLGQVKEEEIRELIQSFHEMTDRLNQLERMRTDLLAGVSHELRTPVTSIRGMLQAINEGVVTGRKADEFIQIGLNEAKRLQEMVNNLLDFASMESGEIYVERATIAIHPFVDEVVKQVRSIPAFSSISIEVDVCPADLACLYDVTHLKQIFFNLLNNSVMASASHIRITPRKVNEQLIIEFTDNGKGISDDEVPFIFERYYRGNSRHKKKQGLGLGLPICRLLAEANGGTIELKQTAPTGTIFCVTLPVIK